jgi:hypothetical protein
VASLREGGDDLLTFFTFPKEQWKRLRTPYTIGQIRLRRIDGWQKIATVLRQQTPRAA